MATTKGHLGQEFKNLQFIKTSATPVEYDIKPSQENDNIRTNDIMYSIFCTDELNSKSYSDQTGNFPITLSQDNKCIFILYHYDTNSIHMVSIKSKHTQHIIQAWEKHS